MVRLLQSNPLRATIFITLMWRVYVGVCGAVGYYFLQRGKFTHFTLIHHGWPANPFTVALDAGIRNDSVWYAKIASHGYSYSSHHISSIGFYPLYPLLVKAVSLIVGNIYVAGMMVSTLCLFGAILLFAVWLDQRGLLDRAPLATALLLGFPFAFFFAAMYTESLYLLLVLGAFIWMERQSWLAAALFTFLAVLARPTGVILIPCLALAAWQNQYASWRRWVPSLAGLLAYILFSLYQLLRFGTPFAYYRTHAGSPEFATPRRYLADLMLQGRPGWPSWYLGGMLVIGLIFLALVPLVYRRFGPVYALFVALSVLLRLTSTLPGMERMVIVAFPVFAALACLSDRRIILTLITVNFWMAVCLTASFAAGWGFF
jgi:hypothetical protein